MTKIAATSEWSNFIQMSSSAAAITKEHCDALKSVCKQNLKEWTALQKEQLDNGLQQVFGKDVGILAVRSSSPEEDSAGSSFAGAYETTLGVMNAQQGLFDAVVDSFASMFDYRIVQYKLQHGMNIDKPRIAIVLQRQIASDVSGVAFGINPHNNCYDEIMISANFGLGETVVSGTVTPDLYIVHRGVKESCIQSKKINEKTQALWLQSNPFTDCNMSSNSTHYEKPINPTGQALSDEQILEVADLVARVEDFRSDGVPVDIEWAYQGPELFLLQARPVTAYIPLFPEMITPRGDRKNLYMDLIVMSQGFSEPFS
jgi:rifampicin phosphotransferase